MLRLFVVLFGCILPYAATAKTQKKPLIYGSPALYGEYEKTSDDINRANKMCGATHCAPRPSPIVVGENINKPAAKHPVKNKSVIAKKYKKGGQNTGNFR